MNPTRRFDSSAIALPAPRLIGTSAIRRLKRCPVSCAIAAAALALYALVAAGADLGSLELSTAAVASGRWWTVFTGHLLHLTVTHLVFCVAGLSVVGLVFEPLLGRAYGLIAALVAAVVALGFVAAHADLSGYYGLSSLAQGLFVAGLVALWRRGERRIPALLLGLLAAKWTFELLGTTSLLASLALDEALYGIAVPWTHVAGGVAGLIAAMVTTKTARGRAASPGDRVEQLEQVA